MTIDLSFVSEVKNLPEFKELLLDHSSDALQIAQTAGLPKLAPGNLAQFSIDHLDEMLPPKRSARFEARCKWPRCWFWEASANETRCC